MRARGQWGLRTRLLLPVALLILLGGGFWGVIGELSARGQMEQLAGRRVTTVLDGIGQRLQERQRAQELFAAVLADQQSVAAGVERGDSVELAQVLAPVQARLGLGRVTVYVQDGRAGRELLHMGPRQVGLTTTAMVEGALLGHTDSAVAVTGQGLAVVAASPIRGHGAVEGALVVGTTLDGDALNEVTDRQGVELAVFRDDRLVSSTANRPDVLQILRDAQVTSGGTKPLDSALAQLNYQIAVKELPDQGVLLAFVSSQDLVDAAAQRNIILAGGMLALLGAVVAVGLLLARDIAQPLASMGVVTGDLRRGNFEQQVAPSSIRELNELGDTINHLGEELRIQLAQLAGERDVLEQITRGEPLAHVLAVLCSLVERQADQVRCAVLLTDEEGPSGAGCWPMPIRSAQDDLLGTFVMYSAARRDQSPAELRMLTSAASLAGIAIERDRAREQAEVRAQALAQSEKLRALGQMASGIAHDLNQSLMLIVSYSDLARRELAKGLPDHEELRELLAAAAQAALDGGESVKQLLVFVRAPRDDATKLPVDLHALAKEVAQLTSPRWRDWAQAEGRPISLHVEARGQPVILGSPARLREALTNLVFNAVDALPQGGTIKLVTAEADGLAILEVTDSGVGMSTDLQEKIFEPFFTTKGDSGTGLGLAMVFGIVQQHAGGIEVQSAPGDGTSFRLSFPLAVKAPVAPAALDPAAPDEALGPLRVLVVDDEPAMTRAVMRMLRPTGHAVSTAASAEEALERLATEAFDVVVSDMGMGPGMNGLELAEQVCRHWPGLRFVLATGWGAAMDIADVRAHGVDAVLAKPYRLGDLEPLLHAPPGSRTESRAA
jgi:signal transduction histidine kinase/ActR/RegA family two-component response regulator